MIFKRVRSNYKIDGLVNLILNMLKYPFLRFKWLLLLNNDASSIFKSIYDQNLWTSSELKSVGGSEKNYTLSLRSWLLENIPKYKIRNIVDPPFYFKKDNVLEFGNDYPKGYKIPRNMFLLKKKFMPKIINYIKY